MSTFDAATAVEALDYDFTSVSNGNGKPCEGKGTIPEPTRGMLEDVIERIQKTASEAGVTAVADAKGAEAVLEALDADAIKALGREMLDAIANLCAGSPTRKQIGALPVRHQNAFFGWLLGQLTDPTQLNGASKG